LEISNCLKRIAERIAELPEVHPIGTYDQSGVEFHLHIMTIPEIMTLKRILKW